MLFLNVSHTGFEPVTSCLSSKRSKPTELMTHDGKIRNIFYSCNISSNPQVVYYYIAKIYAI